MGLVTVDRPSDRNDARRHYRAVRAKLPLAYRTHATHAINEALIALLEHRPAQCVAMYAASVHEVPLWPTYEHLRRRGVDVVFPRVREDGLTWHRAATQADFQPGAYGLLEPVAASSVPTAAVSAWCCPGVAFDHSGHRLGSGKGYYDRALAGASGLRLGIAFGVQLVAAPSLFPLDPEPWDQPMDFLVTEEGAIPSRWPPACV